LLSFTECDAAISALKIVVSCDDDDDRKVFLSRSSSSRISEPFCSIPGVDKSLPRPKSATGEAFFALDVPGEVTEFVGALSTNKAVELDLRGDGGEELLEATGCCCRRTEGDGPNLLDTVGAILSADLDEFFCPCSKSHTMGVNLRLFGRLTDCSR
jgi:hypothetical protein